MAGSRLMAACWAAEVVVAAALVKGAGAVVVAVAAVVVAVAALEVAGAVEALEGEAVMPAGGRPAGGDAEADVRLGCGAVGVAGAAGRVAVVVVVVRGAWAEPGAGET